MSSVKNKVGSDGGNTTDTEEGTTTRGIDVTKEKYLVNEKNQINKQKNLLGVTFLEDTEEDTRGNGATRKKTIKESAGSL